MPSPKLCDAFNPSVSTRLARGVALALIIAGTGVLRATPVIVIDRAASRTEQFAAREFQRYIYDQTGELLTINVGGEPTGEAVVIATRTHAWAVAHGGQATTAQTFHVESKESGNRRQLWIVGGDDIGTLYGVYHFLERSGVRFYLDQDVVPKKLGPFVIPEINEDRAPLFSVRGIQPFHDFAEGPDWWNTDDYLAIIGQLPKLGLNFVGLHTYPESGTGPEPTVWIGERKDERANGSVAFAYPATYHTTERSGRYWWSYAPLPTSQFVGGAAQLYDRDDYGSDVMRGNGFEQQTPAGSIEVFNRTGAMLHDAFQEAHNLGVLTCVGTETPLTLPALVKARSQSTDEAFKRPDWAKAFYTAMFEHIQRTYPVDYYWLWTTESWTWEGNKPEDFAATENDIKSALSALTDLHSPITLATCGWVLGPQHDRAALDKILPPSSPMSAINRTDGHDAVDRQFANLSNRPRWAIPWLENDPFLTSPQLWAGRMLFDGADAKRLGQTGLIGIHWRTGTTEPTLAALSKSMWDQSYTPKSFDPSRIRPQTASGAIGGQPFPARVEASAVPAASVRMGVTGYEMLIPNGVYTVTLGFSELEKIQPGQRVFGVKLQGNVVVAHLDLAAAHRATQTLTLSDVKVTDSRLLLDFIKDRGETEIASIEVVGHTDINSTAYARRINCGGEKFGDFEADYLEGRARPDDRRSMPVDEFYRDFAMANFGANVADAAGKIFAGEDGRNLPEPCNWIDGPGDIIRNQQPWTTVEPSYAFVDELEKLREQVSGTANRERLDYWLNQFRALRLIGELGCEAGALDRAIETLKKVVAPEEAQAFARSAVLPVRIHLARLWEDLLRTEIAGARTTGELGTIANLEQRSRIHQHLLDKHDELIKKALGHSLPVEAEPSADYTGESEIILTTVRRFAHVGETIDLRVLLIGKELPSEARLYWRKLGEKSYHTIALQHASRALYRAKLPGLSNQQTAIEYYIEASWAGTIKRWPADSQEDQSIVLY